LDILDCLVERGAEQQQEHVPDADDSETLIANVSEELRKIKKVSDESDESFSIRVAVLEELLKSHAYAVEMKRAAHSASTWLKSIGRSTTGASAGKGDRMEDPQQAPGEEDKSEGDSSGANDSALKMEMATLKAMLHSSQMELKDKAEANQKLDTELSKCRAEIGRLRSASRSEVRNGNDRQCFCSFVSYQNSLSCVCCSHCT
jgi:hypothetical protein